MSVLIYGPCRMQIQETKHFAFGPEHSEDGVDYLRTALDLAVTAVVNQQALATLGPNQIAGAGLPYFDDAPAHAGGDSLGLSLKNLRALLLAPRQALTFSIGGDQVVAIPAGGDAKNGPLVRSDTRIEWITGTRTARIYFHVKAWIVEWVPRSSSTGGLPHVVLSNRFAVSSTTDNDYYARRLIRGQMIIDPSQLAFFAGVPAGAGVLTPDNFRAVSFLQIPLGFKRENVEVMVSSDNTTLDYSYVDQETPLSLGLRSLATDIGAFATCGITDTLGQVSGITAAMAGVVSWAGNQWPSWALRTGAAALGLGPMAIGRAYLPSEDVGATMSRVALLAGEGLPKIVGSGVARIKGQRDANKADLVQLAINILIDRFTTQANDFGAYFNPNQQPRIGRITIMQDVKERMVEVNISFIPKLVKQIAITANIGGNLAAQALTLMNLNTPVFTQGAAGTDPVLSGQQFQANPPPPNSLGTRGAWLGALVVSLLATPGQPPVLPIDPAVNVDLAAFI